MTSPVSLPALHKLLAADFDGYENLMAQRDTFTPAWTNLTVGSGTSSGRKRRTGRHIDLRLAFTFGSGSSVGTRPRFTLPDSASMGSLAEAEDVLGVGTAFDATAQRWVVVAVPFSTTDIELMYVDGSGNLQQITATAPFTWTTSDRLIIRISALELTA